MAINDLLTLESLLRALNTRQAQRELNAAVLMAETALREQAQKNRQALARLTAY
jgi:hypothetical protein